MWPVKVCQGHRLQNNSLHALSSEYLAEKLTPIRLHSQWLRVQVAARVERVPIVSIPKHNKSDVCAIPVMKRSTSSHHATLHIQKCPQSFPL